MNQPNSENELDALIAAPDHHRLLLENDRVRVLETIISPGDTVPVHTHCWPSVYTIQSWSDFVRRDDAGNVTLDSREANITAEPGTAMWSDAIGPHSLENVGDTDIHLISVEIKDR